MLQPQTNLQTALACILGKYEALPVSQETVPQKRIYKFVEYVTEGLSLRLRRLQKVDRDRYSRAALAAGFRSSWIPVTAGFALRQMRWLVAVRSWSRSLSAEKR